MVTVSGSRNVEVCLSQPLPLPTGPCTSSLVERAPELLCFSQPAVNDDLLLSSQMNATQCSQVRHLLLSNPFTLYIGAAISGLLQSFVSKINSVALLRLVTPYLILKVSMRQYLFHLRRNFLKSDNNSVP